MVQFLIGIRVNPWSESKGSFLFSTLLFPPPEFCWLSTAHPNHRRLGHASRQGDKLLLWKGPSSEPVLPSGHRADWEERVVGCIPCSFPLSYSAFPAAHPSCRNDQTWLGNGALSHMRTCWWPVTPPPKGATGKGVTLAGSQCPPPSPQCIQDGMLASSSLQSKDGVGLGWRGGGMNYMGPVPCPCSSWWQNLDQGVGIIGSWGKLSDPDRCLRSRVFLKALWKLITLSQDLDRGADPTPS